MTTFPNAPASPSALFDNAPTVQVTPTWHVATNTPHLTPATRIAQGRNGRWYAHDVTMQYGRPLPLELALKRVAIGRTVFVAREDAGAVMEAVGTGVTTGDGGPQ